MSLPESELLSLSDAIFRIVVRCGCSMEAAKATLERKLREGISLVLYDRQRFETIDVRGGVIDFWKSSIRFPQFTIKNVCVFRSHLDRCFRTVRAAEQDDRAAPKPPRTAQAVTRRGDQQRDEPSLTPDTAGAVLQPVALESHVEQPPRDGSTSEVALESRDHEEPAGRVSDESRLGVAAYDATPTVIELAEQQAKTTPAANVMLPLPAISQKGRKSGSRSIDEKERLKKMLTLLAEGKACSVNDAANQVAHSMPLRSFSQKADAERIRKKFTKCFGTAPSPGLSWAAVLQKVGGQLNAN
jgi:hypothetical protein